MHSNLSRHGLSKYQTMSFLLLRRCFVAGNLPISNTMPSIVLSKRSYQVMAGSSPELADNLKKPTNWPAPTVDLIAARAFIQDWFVIVIPYGI
jgi:hypothetical protein